MAKKLLTELVFNTAYIKGVKVTLPQTQAILDTAIVNNVPGSGIQAVPNLWDAWVYMFAHLDAPSQSSTCTRQTKESPTTEA